MFSLSIAFLAVILVLMTGCTVSRSESHAEPETDPPPPKTDDTPIWKLVFEEDLTTVELQADPDVKTPASPHWVVAYGPWESSPDGLVKTQHNVEGVLFCRVPVIRGAVRIEYEAMSLTPGDMSLIMGTRPGYMPHSPNAVFFGFAMNGNQRSKIELPDGTEVDSPAATAIPGTWHTVAVERSGGNLIMEIDGREVLRAADVKKGFLAPYIALYGWNTATFRHITVSTRDDPELEAYLPPKAVAREAAFPQNVLSLADFQSAVDRIGYVKVTLPNNPECHLPTRPLAGIFTDHMVLQRGIEIPVWGWNDPGGSVTVTLNGQQAEATAGADGRWMVRLPAMAAGGPYEMDVTGSNTSAHLTDVYIGDVWIASGQSNMQMALKECDNAETEQAAANHPLIRFLKISNPGLKEPAVNVGGEWKPVTPAVAGNFSGAAYFFARYLQNELNVPIGIIQNAVGGKPAESYTPWERLIATDVLKADMENRRAHFETELEELDYEGIAINNSAPAALWNSLVNPLVPYAIKGVIWYQGESNADRAQQYQTLFPLMINAWRQSWGQGDFPFVFVQLANYKKSQNTPSESDWAELREAQTMTLNTPNTGMAVAIDIGDPEDIHPRNKQDVGLRLGLAALKVAYQRDIVYSGPQFRKLAKESGALRIYYDHVGGGLTSRGGELKTFAVAGTDGVFKWAHAEIENDTVLVHADAVRDPVSVRYAWADNPAGCNLYNAEDLPAVPFRATIE